MSANITDKITDTRNAARPNSARVSSGRSAGGTTLACDNLAGWPTASKVHFVTYQIDSSSNPVAGTQLDCYGIVSGNNIGSFTVVDGTDTGNAVNDVVEMLPTAAWGQGLSDWAMTQHSRLGTHVGITNTGGMTNTGGLTTDTLTVSGASTHTGATTLTGAVGGAGFSLATIIGPSKFSAYRAGAWTDGNGGWSKISFDSEEYDTGSNFDITTNVGRFTAPTTGSYHFDAYCRTSVTASSFMGISLYKNGVIVKGDLTVSSAVTTAHFRGVSADLSLASGDFIEVYSYGTGGAGSTGSSTTYFNGRLVST